MAKKNIVTNNTETKTEDKIKGVIFSMKNALIEAHNTGNVRCISKDDDVTDQALTQWTLYVEELRGVVNKYIDVINAKGSSEREVTLATGRVYSAWSDVVKNGTADEFDSHFFIRKSDVSMLTFCGCKKQTTAKGSMIAHKTKAEFRLYVEWLIGCRLTANAVLDDADRDVIDDYEGALRSINAATKALNGYMKSDSAVKGLIDQVKDAEEKVASMDKTLTEHKVAKDLKESILAGLNLKVKELKAEKEAKEKSLAAAEKLRDEKQARYDEIMATIEKIEC